MSLTHALKWSFLSELASKAIQPVVFIILARLLTPEDFGVMSAALMVIGFSQIFWEAGMGKALIQRQSDVDDAANAAFWINLGLGFFIAILLFSIADSVAYTFFHDGRVVAVLQIMTLQVFLGALSSVHTALLQKEMGFKKLFWVRFATVSLPGLASIPLALNGMGYWALVAGSIIGQVAQVIMLWRISHWRPKWKFNRLVAKKMGRFGVWVGLSGLLAWFYIWADSFIVGMYLGSHDLGLYRTGNQFALMGFSLLFGPVLPVLYSYLSQMNQDKDRLGRAIEKIVKILAFIAIPLAFFIYSVSDFIGIVFFGEQWEGIGFVIGVMALMHGFSWIVGMNGEVYRAMGKPSYETIVTAITLLVYLVAYLYSVQRGFDVFVWVRFMLALGAMFLHFFVLRKIVPICLFSIVRYIVMVTIVSGLVVTVSHFVASYYMDGSWPVFIMEGLLELLAFCVIGFVVERKGVVRDILGLIKWRAA